MTIYYTFRERTVRNRTVGEAVKAAEIRLDGRCDMCVNAVHGRDLGEQITLVQLNDLVDRLVSDSLYHAAWGSR